MIDEPEPDLVIIDGKAYGVSPLRLHYRLWRLRRLYEFKPEDVVAPVNPLPMIPDPELKFLLQHVDNTE